MKSQLGAIVLAALQFSSLKHENLCLVSGRETY